MNLIPKWTKKGELKSGGRDPLGLSRISERITSKLVPGIITMTRVARNYIFYCWSIGKANQKKFKTLAQYKKILERLEAAWVIGGLLDDKKSNRIGKGSVGKLRALRRIRKSKNNEVDVDFSVFKMKGGGIYQYYKNSMSQLGLLINTKFIPILTESGKNLAQIFENNIKETTYFKKYLENKIIPKELLFRYGQISNFIRLKDYKNEREQLTGILFSKNQNQSDIDYSRMNTLLFILDLFHVFEEKKTLLTNEHFRNIIYYGKTVDNILYSTISSNILNIISYWRFFVFHNYLTFALENILSCFILATNKSENGITEKQFIKENLGFLEIISKNLSRNIKSMKLNEVINSILKESVIERRFDIITSKMFDKKVKLDSKYSEFQIVENIRKLNKDNFNERIGFSVLLIIITMIRYRQYIDTFDEKIIWINEISYVEEFSLSRVYNGIRNQLSTMTLIDLFKFLIGKIINQHNLIALEKEMSYGLDTYRFITRGDRYIFKQYYEYTERNDKFNAIKNILEDIGLIEFINDYYHLTSYGINILKEYNNV